jgi:hypothetical protein
VDSGTESGLVPIRLPARIRAEFVLGELLVQLSEAVRQEVWPCEEGDPGEPPTEWVFYKALLHDDPEFVTLVPEAIDRFRRIVGGIEQAMAEAVRVLGLDLPEPAGRQAPRHDIGGASRSK